MKITTVIEEAGKWNHRNKIPVVCCVTSKISTLMPVSIDLQLHTCSNQGGNDPSKPAGEIPRMLDL